jgi:hypothetical protein
MKIGACLALSICCLTARPAGAALEPEPHYEVVRSISGPGGAWDYAALDEQTGRLYLAQSGITALALRSGKLTARLVAGKMTHGVAVLPHGWVAVDDAATKTITVFDGVTGAIVRSIATADRNPGTSVHALDTLVLDPATNLLLAVNGDTGLLLLVDYRRGRVLGTIPLRAPAESAVADGGGHVYVNVNRPGGSEIDVLNTVARRVQRRMPLRGCRDATGLALDRKAGLLVAACANGFAELLRTDGRVAKVIRVGKGADAVMVDRARGRVFVPGGQGMLTVLSVRDARDIRVLQVMRTPRGTRLGAVDERTGRVYLPSGRFGPPIPPNPYPSVVPGTFRILVLAPVGEP